MEMVIHIQHPQPVLSPQQKQQIKLISIIIQYKQNISLKCYREERVCSLFSAQANRGTPQMLRFSNTFEEKHLEMSKEKLILR